MTHVATFPVTAAAPLPSDDALSDWSGIHLRDCKKWLVRRHPLAPPTDLLAAACRRHAERHDDTSLPRALAELTERRAREPSIEIDDGEWSALVERLARDLALYSSSLSEGKIRSVRVVPTGCVIVPLFLPGPDELFLPYWLMSHVPEYLFHASPLFPAPPRATTSWLLFHSLVLVADRPQIPTLASFYGIRESD